MEFAVKLIKVPDIGEMTGWQVFDLVGNATHIGGPFWFYEGDEDALNVEVEVVSYGITEGGLGEMDETERKIHCEEIFGVDAHSEPPWWKMLSEQRRKGLL